MEARQVVGAVHAAAETVVQQRLRVNRVAPRRGQVKFDAEIVSGDAESGGSKGRRVDALTLLVQTPPVDFGVIRPRPKADVAELPQADAAAHEVLVGVQDQVQQVLVSGMARKLSVSTGLRLAKKWFSSSCASSEESNRRRCSSM